MFQSSPKIKGWSVWERFLASESITLSNPSIKSRRRLWFKGLHNAYIMHPCVPCKEHLAFYYHARAHRSMFRCLGSMEILWMFHGLYVP